MRFRTLLHTARELGPVETTRRLLRKYAAELAFTAVAYVLLYKAFRLQGLEALLGGLSHHAVVLLLAIVLGQVFKILPVWTEIGMLLEHHRQTPHTLRRPLGRFLRHRVTALAHARQSIMGSEGLTLDRREQEFFVDACFYANRGRRYVGTDSNVPTEFYRLYPTYLDEQREARIDEDAPWDVRVLFPTESELVDDLARDHVVFEEFSARHLAQHVHLLQVDKSIADGLAEIQRFPSSDMGIYGWTFVAFYKPLKRKDATVAYRVHLRPIDPELKRRLREYVTMLSKHVRELYVEQCRVCLRMPSENAKRDYLLAMLSGSEE